MSENQQRDAVDGGMNPAFLLWAMAPALAAFPCIWLALIADPDLVGLFIMLFLLFSLVSQYLWSVGLLERLGVPEKGSGIKAVPITLLGLALNAAIFLGGCRCVLDSMASPVAPG